MALGALVTLVLGSGCGEQDVVVATAVTKPDGAPPFDGAPGQGCADDTGCLPEAYCSKPSCAAPFGHCMPRPLQCDTGMDVVCGCDGVNYWNDCLRRADGDVASTKGECSDNAAVCGGAEDAKCPVSDAFCNKLARGAPSACQAPSVGFCWVLPDACPADGGPPTWRSCGEGPPQCVDTCTAIASQMPYQSAPPMCP